MIFGLHIKENKFRFIFIAIVAALLAVFVTTIELSFAQADEAASEIKSESTVSSEPDKAPAKASEKSSDKAEQALGDNDLLGKAEIISKSFTALMILFVLAVLLENAMEILFNWRVFLTYFSLRGVRTPIMIVFAWIVISLFDIDIVEALMNAYSIDKSDKSSWATSLITALIIAGGSSGVNNVMHALGFRSDKRVKEIEAQPKKSQAWIAFRQKNESPCRPIPVRIQQLALSEEEEKTFKKEKELVAIAGSINQFRPTLKELLIRNRDRFPPNGGYEVTPGKVYQISVEGQDAKGNIWIDKSINKQKYYVFSNRAIVDFEVNLEEIEVKEKPEGVEEKPKE